MRSDLIDIEMMIHAETEKAVRASDDGDRENAVWLAKKHVEFEREIEIGRRQTLTMPQWLAEEKGLV